MRRALIAVALAALWALPAAAEPVTVRFVFSSATGAERDLHLELLERFNREQDAVRVEPVSRLWEAYDLHDSYLRLLALEDPSVDVYLVDTPWVPEMAYPGWLLPLEGRLPGDWLEGFDEVALEGGTYAGRVYGLPLSLKGNVLFYRKDLLAAHDLEPPRTLAELDRQARLLRQREGLPVGVGLHGRYLFNDLYPALWASGGQVVDERGAVLLAAGDANLRALEAFAALFEGPAAEVPVPRDRFDGRWTADYRAPLEDFARGDAAFVVSWTPDLTPLQAADSPVRGRVGVAAIPGTDAARGGASNLGSWYLSVSRFSRHPEAAVAFVRWYLSDPIQRVRLEDAAELPSRPAVMSVAGTAARFPIEAEMARIVARAGIRPRVPNEREVDALVEAHLQRVVRGEQSAREGLARAQREVEQAIMLPTPPPDRLTAAASAPAKEASTVESGAGRPLRLAGLALLALALALAALALAQRRRPVLKTLAAKLMVFGSATIIALMVLGAAVMTSQALRDQERELRASRAFHRAELTAHARTVGRNLALSTALVLEQADDRTQRQTMRQLMLAGHFSDQVVVLELLDPAGEVLHAARDALFVAEGAGHVRPTAAADVAEAVRRRAIAVRERPLNPGEPEAGSFIEVLVPVFAEGRHAGALRVGLSDARYRAQLVQVEARHRQSIDEIQAVAAGTTLGLLAVGLALLLWLARRVTRPIVGLTRDAERIRVGELDVQIPPGPPDEIGTLAAAMAEMVEGLRDRDFIHAALGRFVAPELADRFLADPDSLALGGELREVSILMSDLRGFTGLSARLGPERMVQLLNRYLGHMSQAILESGGTINEFIGDAILVLFGAPADDPDHAVHAVRCAIRMQQAMEVFNAESGESDLPPLEMGIGVHSGTVVAGNIGSEEHIKYGVVGDPVNLTARVESLTVGGEVLVSADTWALCGDQVDGSAPRAVKVKGREEPLGVRTVLGMSGEPGLRVPVAAQEPLAPTDLLARVHVIRGKHVDEEGAPARVVGLGPAAAELRLSVGVVQPLANVRLALELTPEHTTGELYAKVTEVAVEGDGQVLARVRFTSVPPADAEALAGRA